MAGMIGLCAIVDDSTAGESWLKTGSAAPGHGASLGSAAAMVSPMRNGQTVADCLFIEGHLLVAANARLDGIQALRDALGSDTPLAASTAELIACAWRRWGPDCPRHLFGDYAFFVHDTAAETTFCARDHIGARPLFYVDEPARFAMAGNIPALLTLPGLQRDLDESFVAASQLQRFFEPGDGSFYRAIRRLEAGHCLMRKDGDTRIWRWWRPEDLPVRSDIGDDDAVREATDLLEQAVADRLVGVDRFACHLSGGIDSSLVAALAARQAAASAKTFELGYSWQGTAEANCDESIWIEAIRDHLKLEHRAPRLSAAELAELLAADWTKGPDVRNLLHEAAVQRDAEDAGVQAILSGWGGDEGLSFHGRGHRPYLLATGRWIALWRSADGPGLREGLRAFYGAARHLWRDFKPQGSLHRIAHSHKSMLDPGFARRTRVRRQPRVREFGHRATMDALIRHSSPTTRIEDWAISGTQHGLTYLYPLLDRRLLEFLYVLPPHMFRRRGVDRWLVREVSRGQIPDLIRNNVSKDEPVRVDRLHRDLGEAYALILKMLDERANPPPHAEYFDMAKIRRFLHQAARTGNGKGRGLRIAVQLLDLT